MGKIIYLPLFIVKSMNSVDDIKTDFMRIYEGLGVGKGWAPIYGRIMASFFLEGRELSQKELSNLTGYSIPSVSRALESLVRMGQLEKYKNASGGYFIYSVRSDYLDRLYPDMVISAFEAWINHYEMIKSNIQRLINRMEPLNFKKEERSEANHLKTILKKHEKALELFIDIFRRITKELESIPTNI